ncbi:MAG: Ig-like domain-containing protein, partial [Gemmatimonadales bacterium]
AGTASVTVSGGVAPPPASPVGSVVVTPGSASGSVGDAAQFTVVVLDTAGATLTGQTVTWRSTNTAVVTVSATGYAAAVGAGSAAIVATAGGKSGQAAITVAGVAAPSQASVASISVSPASATVSVGGSQPLSAVLKDSAGNVLTGRTVTWSSNAVQLATVSAVGLVAALVPGNLTVTAASGGKSGSASITVAVLAPPPQSGSWPNEPSGSSVVTDYGFGDDLPVTTADVPIPGGSGWHEIYNGAQGGSLTRVSDPTAPFSPSSVLDYFYPIGFPSSVGPGTLYYDFTPAKEVYVGLWWKPSNPWQGNDAGRNKICYLMTASGKLIALEMFNQSVPYIPGVVVEFPADNGPIYGNGQMALGQWHRLEWHLKYSSSPTTADGQMQVWVDGALDINQNNLIMPADDGFAEFQLASTFGGDGTAKRENDHFWFDHVHISRR